MAQKADQSAILELFKRIDKDNSGTLTASEIMEVLNDPKAGMKKKFTLQEVQAIVAKLDSSGDGKVDFKEFLEIFKAHK